MAERGVIFKEAPILSPKRSWFDMSNENLLSLNFGKIVPTMCMECLPGDHIKLKTHAFGRVYPTLAPTFGKVNLFAYQFFVRSRDIWTDFGKFITNNDQKKTWQQQESFVAPAMPTFNPVYLQYEGPFSAGGESSPVIAHKNTYALVVNAVDNDGNHCILKSEALYNKTRQSDDSTDPFYKNFTLVFFKPKPSEYEPEFLTSVGSEKFENLSACDLFADSTLADYLGIDLSGFYKNTQWKFWTRMWNGFSNHVTTEDVRDVLLTQFRNSTSEAEMSEANNLSFKPNILIKLDDESFLDFLNTHAVVGIFYASQADDYLQDIMWPDGTGLYGIGGSTFSTQTPISGSTHEFGNLCELPLRAYRFIYDEYFRDQNYIQVNPNTDFSANGSHTTASSQSVLTNWWFAKYFSLENKAWEHDPYTTALPSPQRGDAVRFLSDAQLTWTDLGSAGSSQHYKQLQLSDTTSTGFITSDTYGTTSSGKLVDLTVDLSAATIENFRWANSMQKYLEKKARTGGRYYEYLLGIWDKNVEDAKLNRPIYLNGEKIPLQISEVLQTSQSDFETSQPLGDMAGRGIMVGSADFLEYECPDYGYLVEVVCVVPRVGYMQGLAPMFTRENYLDFPLPDFAQLGEEYVKQSELYYSVDPAEDDKAFGYQSRYYQWKYRRDEAHSDFKNSLDFWHWYRKFDSAPVNGQKFLEVDPDYRQFAVTSKNFNHVYLSVEHDMQVNRALPEFGVPVL